MCDYKTWKKIKAEYLRGGTSFAKLAGKYGISKSVIGKRAKDEGWADSRGRIADESRTRVEARIADQQVDHFLKLYALLDRYEDLIGEQLEGGHHGDTGVRDLGTAIQTAVAVRRDLYDLPNENQRQGRERLKLLHRQIDMKEKMAERENAGDSMEQTAIVIHMGDDDETD